MDGFMKVKTEKAKPRVPRSDASASTSWVASSPPPMAGVPSTPTSVATAKKGPPASPPASLAAPVQASPPLPSVAQEATEPTEITAKAWFSDLIKFHRNVYNRFNYLMKSETQVKKAEWQSIYNDGSAAQAEVFVDEVNSTNVRKRKKQTEAKIIDETNEGWLDKDWTPYKTAADRYGEDVVNAMLQAKSVPARRMADVPDSAEVPWPRYLELKLTRESEREWKIAKKNAAPSSSLTKSPTKPLMKRSRGCGRR